LKTLIDIDKVVWGKVKDFATVKEVSLNLAVEDLLSCALTEFGYLVQKEETTNGSRYELSIECKACREELHDYCTGKKIVNDYANQVRTKCTCKYCKKENEKALEKVRGPVSNAIASLSQERTQDDD
jgi:hypothetical protein